MRVAAPGRVNLIGGHVDFHGGPVVAAAIDRFVTIDVLEAGGGTVRIISDGYPNEVVLPLPPVGDPASVEPSWGRLPAAVIGELARLGCPVTGMSATVHSELPAGGGLSSSAAFSLAVATAATRCASWQVEPVELALACQRAEAAVGVPCGVQDQLAITIGGVVHIDCRSLDVEPLLLGDDVSILVFGSRVSRSLEESPWAQRRAESFRQAQLLGVERLVDASPDSDTTDLPLAAHVIGEISRVGRFAEALRGGDLVAAGELMVESHRSSRDLWGSSLPQLDLLVAESVAAGAYGARLTGGGFGGFVVALCPSSLSGEVVSRVSSEFHRSFGSVPQCYNVRPVVGLGGSPFTSCADPPPTGR